MLFKFGFRFGIIWISLSLVGGLFVSLFCMRQTDLKSLIAFSSVAHISMVIGGIMTLRYSGACRLVHLVGFIIKKFVTMQHGHVNVKLQLYLTTTATNIVIHSCFTRRHIWSRAMKN